ncbi:MAG: 3' terminal RNA ribose 2'-O-methyltransferase Hen1 [Cyanobacteria bacterium J06643_4]
MLLTITTTHRPATDLGYLLHKHPERCQTFPMGFGQAHVFYAEATKEKCAATLLLDVDPVALVRGKIKRGRAAGHREKTFDQYVNDRPYAASSFLSVTLAKVFGTAMSGRCKTHPELAQTPIPLTVSMPVLPCKKGASFLQELFEPLGYEVDAIAHPLDTTFPDWGNSRYLGVTLTHTLKLSELLSHLYVLIPVLDEDKHYYFGEDEIAKLLRHGEGWLKEHPLREEIARRYFKRKRQMAAIALAQLMAGDDPDAEAAAAAEGWQKQAAKKPVTLNQQRMEQVVDVLKGQGAKSVIDLGCGEGSLLRMLLQARTFERVMGMDVSYRELEKAKRRLKDELSPMQQQHRVDLIQGSLIYRDDRLKGYDAATVIEVIEHMDLDRLAAFERVLFEFTQPPVVIITTPNSEFNVRFAMLPAGQMRHQDHRFEWTRREFEVWAQKVCDKFHYTVTFQGIGFDDPDVGSPTQMGVFKKQAQKQSAQKQSAQKQSAQKQSAQKQLQKTMTNAAEQKRKKEAIA